MNSRTRWTILVLAVLAFTIEVLMPNAQGHLRYVINATEISRVGTGLPYSLEEADRLGLAMLAGLLLVSSIQLTGPRLSQTLFFVTLRKRLDYLGQYSPNLARVLVGLLLLASWPTGTLLTPQFGTALQTGPLVLLVWMQLLAGALLLLGLGTRLASILFALIYLATFLVLGIHGLDHVAMLGIAIFLFIEGGGSFALDGLLRGIYEKFKTLNTRFENYRKYSLPALRITLGTALVWLGLTEKVLAPALTSYAIVKYGVPYFPDLTVFTFVFGVFEIVLGFHFVLGLFNRAVSAVYLGLLLIAIPVFGEWINHFYLFAVAILLLTRGAGPFRIDVRFVGESPRLLDRDVKHRVRSQRNPVA